MKKMSIYVDPEVDRELTLRAEREGTTKAALIRRALADAAGIRPRPKAVALFSGPGDLSTKVDEYLRETGFGEV
jgi:hypothetical protein